jgi:phage tail protein X
MAAAFFGKGRAMSSSSKMLLFAAVLTVGACTASLFRKPPGTTATSSSETSTPFAHRLEGPRVVAGPSLGEFAPPAGNDVRANRPAPPRASLAQGAVSNGPPEFPESSPIGNFPLSAPPAWTADEPIQGRPMYEEIDAEGDAPRRLAGGKRMHRVEDGDTLASLAERYFRDAAKAELIRSANRDLLPPSGALPIGVDLVIPAATGVPRGTPREVPVEAASTRTTSEADLSWRGAAHSSANAAVTPASPSSRSEPTNWPADPAAPEQSNPVAPGVIRPASEPLP